MSSDAKNPDRNQFNVKALVVNWASDLQEIRGGGDFRWRELQLQKPLTPILFDNVEQLTHTLFVLEDLSSVEF